eukprot:2770626-Rhodomonas_salina.4
MSSSRSHSAVSSHSLRLFALSLARDPHTVSQRRAPPQHTRTPSRSAPYTAQHTREQVAVSAPARPTPRVR